MAFGFSNFFNGSSKRSAKGATSSRRDRSPLKPRRLMTESLEERQLLAVDVFNLAAANLSDSANVVEISATDLSIDAIKQAIQDAAATPEDDVIVLSGGELKFDSADDEIVIDMNSSSYGAIAITVADGASVSIDGGALSRIFSVKNGEVYLEGLTLTNGSSDFGGAIANAGNLTLTNVSITDSVATKSGGAIANQGALYLQNSVISGSSASENGAAIYEGEFDWGDEPGDETPEWTVVPDQTGSKGTTITVDLSEYVNDGDWTYSYEIAETTSSILAEEPTLNGSVLSFTFIDNDSYFAEDDYSALSVTVTAASGSESASTTFSVSLAEQTSTVLAAILSNMTVEDAQDEYYIYQRRVREGFGREDGVPDPSVVDVSQTVTAQIWLQDFGSDKSGDLAMWDSGEYYMFGATYRLHLENATLSTFSEADEYYRNVYVHIEKEDGDWQFMVGYFADTKIGYADALLLDVLELNVTDPTKPVSVTIYQDSTDWTCPSVQRMYGAIIDGLDRYHLNVDPSQTLFISTTSDSAEPLSSTPGQPFVTNISRAELDASVSNASADGMVTAISNSLIVGNEGANVIYVSESGTADIANTTIADNNASAAVILYDGTSASAVSVANSIVVNGDAAPFSGAVTAANNLLNASVSGNVEYQNGALFAGEGDYSLATGSEAINIGDDSAAIAVDGTALTIDLAGNARFVAAVDAGAYEYQGVAPNAPRGVSVTDYYDSAKKPVLSWRAATGTDAATGYNIYRVSGTTNTLVATVDASTTSYADLASAVPLYDNRAYKIAVSAFNAFGESDLASVSFRTTVPPTGTITVETGAYDQTGKSISVSWNALDNATGYRVEVSDSDGESWTEAGSTANTTLTVEGLADNTDYIVRVVAYNAKGDGAEGTASFSTLVAPAAPTNVAFSAYDSDSKSAVLTWDAVDYADGYAIQAYDAANDTWVDVELDDATATSYTLTDMVDFETYRYRVSAHNDAGSSAWVEASVTASAAPAAPTGLTASFNRPALAATLSWTASEGAEGYRVYVQEDGEWTQIATTGSITTTYLAQNLELYSDYVFGVSAYNDEGESGISSVALSTLVAPEAPTNLTVVDADSYDGSGTVVVEWDAATGADSYAVSLTVDGETTLLGNTDGTSYEIAGLDNYADYTVSVVAVNEAGSSDVATVAFSTMIAPTAEFAVEAGDYADGEVELTWDAVDYATGYRVEVADGDSWTTVGTTTATSYTVDGLEDNSEYSYRVVAFNDKGDGSTAEVSFSTLVAPAAPTDAAFGEYDSDAKEATLTWSAVDNVDGYKIEYLSGDEWIAVDVDDETATSYTATDLADNAEYSYRVSAYNAAGSSDWVVATLDTTVEATIPAAPTDFAVATYNEETHRATLVWVDNADNEEGYEMQYSRDGENWIVAATLAADSTTRVANGLTPGQTYYFRVAAFNSAGYSDWATTTIDVPAEAPAAPTDLVFGEYDAENRQIEMSWTINSDDELGFRVQYSYDGENWNASGTVDAGVNTRTATGLVEGRTYYFRVAAYNLYGTSDWAENSVTIPVTTPTAPAAPSDIEFSNLTYTNSGAQVDMSWTDNSDDEDRFVVQFSYDGETWHGAGSTDADVSTRTATGLVEGRTYYFRVAAYNSAGYSDWATATYVVPYETINAPGDIVFGDYVNGTVEMSWEDTTDGTASFVIQFSYDGENWHRAGTTPAGVTTRTATGMTPGRLYYFRVASYNGVSYSDWTEGTFLTPSGAPSAPSDLVFSDYSASARTVEMSWTDGSNDEIGFNVEYSIDGGNTWRASGNTSRNVTTRTATGLHPGTTYEFRVRAFNAYGASGWTYGTYEVATNADAPAAPTDFVYGDYDAEAKTLGMSWTDNADNETGYKVQYSVDGGTTWYAAGTYSADTESRTATGVVAGRSYIFRVAAYNASGSSAWLVSDAFEASSSENVPAAPTGLTFGEYDSEKGAVEMSWTDNSDNEKGFRVQYSVDEGVTWNDSAYLAANTTSRTATGIAAGRVYSFRVAAYNNYGYSEWLTGSYSAISTSDVAAPTDLAFSYNVRRHTISVTWSGDASSYNAQYAVGDSGEWLALETSGTSATISQVSDGLTYRFRVQAVDEDGALSAWTEDEFDTAASSSAAVADEIFDDFFGEEDVDLIAESLLVFKK